MVARHFLFSSLLVILVAFPAQAQTVAQRDPQALILLNQSLAALTSGTAVNDVSLQATANYIAGSDQESGTATLLAKPGESRVTLILSGGQPAEVRNNSGGIPQGSWTGPDGLSHPMALHNCWSDPSWFFPALSFETALNDPQLAIIYIGSESKAGLAVQHVQFSRLVPGQSDSTTTFIQQLSAVDVYLDAASYLPVAFGFNVHPDEDAGLNIPLEIQFGDYRLVNGVRSPYRIQKLLQGTLFLDFAVTTFTINSGLSDTLFTVPQA